MPGPLPKPDGVRRRRNKPSVAAVTLPAGGSVEVPELRDADLLLPSTFEWWETVWGSPMASMYLPCDFAALERLALMIDLARRGEAGSRLLSEIRALEDRFGLSPAARRRLQWDVRPVQVAVPDPPPDDDEERFLRAVRG